MLPKEVLKVKYNFPLRKIRYIIKKMFPNTLSSISTIIAITINPEVLWIGFGLVSAFTAIISIILFYHWTHYGYKPVKTGFMGAVYFIGIAVLLGVIFFAMISYINSI